MARRPRSRIRARAVRPRVRLLPIDVLRSHEGLEPKLLEALREDIAREGALREPILVEASHYVILNGHHRFAALRDLGCRRVPAYIVDYFDPRIELGLWPNATVDRVTKEEVIQRGLDGRLFPPKTTRHTVRFELPDAAVSLERLTAASGAVAARSRAAHARTARPGGGTARRRRHRRPPRRQG